jgi:hypothetical protein
MKAGLDVAETCSKAPIYLYSESGIGAEVLALAHQRAIGRVDARVPHLAIAREHCQQVDQPLGRWQSWARTSSPGTFCRSAFRAAASGTALPSAMAARCSLRERQRPASSAAAGMVTASNSASAASGLSADICGGYTGDSERGMNGAIWNSRGLWSSRGKTSSSDGFGRKVAGSGICWWARSEARGLATPRLR